MRRKCLIVALAAITLLGTISGCGKKESKEAIKVSEDNPITTECENYFANANHISVSVVKRTETNDLDGNSSMTYEKYVTSDINLKDETDSTFDSTEALASGELIEDKIKELSFKEVFGFDYKGKSADGIFNGLMESNEMDTNLKDVTFDDETYDANGRKLYVLNGESSVLKSLLKDTKYDELKSSKVYYQTMKTEAGVEIPENVTAEVEYRIGDVTYKKTVYIEITIYSGEEE